MKRLGVPLTTVVVLLSAATLSLAQGDTNPPAGTLERPAAVPDSSGSGTAREGLGSTGWTGGSRSQGDTTTGQNSHALDSDAAQQQPLMATGADLLGPPKRFPAAQTPE
jgi:hypothetical protein